MISVNPNSNRGDYRNEVHRAHIAYIDSKIETLNDDNDVNDEETFIKTNAYYTNALHQYFADNKAEEWLVGKINWKKVYDNIETAISNCKIPDSWAPNGDKNKFREKGKRQLLRYKQIVDFNKVSTS